MFTIDWSSWNKPVTKESEIELLNRYKKGKHISMPLYKKALAIINEGYQFQCIIEDKGHIKVLDVKKSNKL
jgi:beta-galactosidase beta subunit